MAGGGVGCDRPAPAPPKPQGILLLVLDCLRADHLGAPAARFAATPRLDELAPESVAFRRAWSPASWTRPSLPSLLTGLYPSEHGLVDEFESKVEKLEARVLPAEAETVAELLRTAGYRTALIGDQVQLSRQFALDQGFDEFRNRTASAANSRRAFLRWLGAEPNQPFFAYLHFLELHWPYCPRGTFGVFDRDPGSRSFCSDWRALGERLTSGEERLSERDLVALRARYAEQLLELDFELGKLFAELRQRGAWDETLIVVTADHGEELADHGGFRHGHSLYEELLHVPFVWKLPKSWGARGGAQLDDLVEIRSFAPTVLAAAGVAIPERISAPSLLPQLLALRRRSRPTEFVVAESNGLFAVRNERFKLIVHRERGERQLFDLVADPGESRNLAASEPEQLAAMEAMLRRWRAALRPLPVVAATDVGGETAEELRALGYLQ